MTHASLRWRKAYDPQALIARIESERVTSEEVAHVAADNYPDVRFAPFIDRTLEVVGSAISWPPGIGPDARYEIMFEAVSSVAHNGVITPEAVLEACAKGAEAWRHRSWQEYVVVSSLSVDPRTQLRGFTLDRAEIRFNANLSSKWDRSALKRQFDHVYPAGYDVDYKTVTISLHAPDRSTALDNARRILDVRRGFWNWYLNRNWTLRMGVARPHNAIVWGPITTVHNLDGTLAEDVFSYDDEFRNDRLPEALPRLKQMLQFERHMATKMRESKIANELEQFIVSYVRALDHSNYETTFRALWPVFESLTGGLNGNYERNLRRMLACYSTQNPMVTSFLAQELEHLKDFRNTLVHEGRPTTRAWAAVQQLKGHVHNALGIFFELFSKFPNMRTAYEFLELPRSETELQRQADMLRRALALRDSKRQGKR